MLTFTRVMSDCIWVTRTGNMTRDNVTSVTPARRKLKKAQALNVVVVTMHCTVRPDY